MRLSAKRNDAFHWCETEGNTFSLTKLATVLLVAASSYYVFELWAPDEPPVFKPPTVAQDVQPPRPSSREVRGPPEAEEHKIQPRLQSRSEPASLPATKRQEPQRSPALASPRTATYHALRDQFLSDVQ
jgi:hypothetical protein